MGRDRKATGSSSSHRQCSDSVPPDRRDRFQVLLALSTLSAARRRGDLAAMSSEADRLQARVEAAEAARLGVDQDLLALAVIGLGITSVLAAGLEQADGNLRGSRSTPGAGRTAPG